METTEGYDPAVWTPDGRPARPPVAHHPRGVRRIGLRLRRAHRRARGDGRGPAVRAVLLDRRPGRQRPAHLGRRGRQEGPPARASPRARPSPRSPSPRTTAAGTSTAIDCAGARGRAAAGRSTATRCFVIDGHTADLILVAAAPTAGLSLFAVEGDARRADPRRRCRRWTRPASRPASSSQAPRPGSSAPTAARPPGLTKTLDLAAVALAAEQVGGAQRCLDSAVDYAKTRIQFGRPIGSFQAIKHKCADMLLEVESAKSAAYYAGWAAAEDSDELPVVASLAKSYCSEAYFHAAAENIQIHGGIGFTWEHDAHLYFKRAKSSELLFGRPRLPPRAPGPAHRHLSRRADRAIARTPGRERPWTATAGPSGDAARLRRRPRGEPGRRCSSSATSSRQPGGAATPRRRCPTLADRLCARSRGGAVVAGDAAGASADPPGTSRASGWLDDLARVVEHRARATRGGGWAAGFGFGGASRCAWRPPTSGCGGVASSARPADLAGWAATRGPSPSGAAAAGVIEPGLPAPTPAAGPPSWSTLDARRRRSRGSRRPPAAGRARGRRRRGAARERHGPSSDAAAGRRRAADRPGCRPLAAGRPPGGRRR